MSKMRWWGWALVVLAVAAAGLGLALRPRQAGSVQARLEGLPPAEGAFARAEGPVEFEFPKDHGPHPDFQTEWWYYTGNLQAEDGRRFGYQLTFFRRALSAPEVRSERESPWGADQVYLAHFALTDVEGGQFHAEERFERGAAGLAGAEGEPGFAVWLQDWRVEQTGEDSYRLAAAQEGLSIALELTDLKGPVLQGQQGYSQKGPEAGNASYYISQTRLESSGTVRVNGEDVAVRGWSWMDHEFSTSALSAGQVGWDWFSIQLDNNREMMVYTLRRADGSIDPYSKGTLIFEDGDTRTLTAEEFSIEATEQWTSPHSGAVYPAGWVIRVLGEDLELAVEPLLADQEWRGSFVYWEGAVKVEGRWGQVAVSGFGYGELTGYGQSMEERF
ncbi:MAG: hypothetical protein JW987_10555 [Anaerolineaceae bacterium]|nr:hypothetical protein [Anaerolineaceae bacterium]